MPLGAVSSGRRGGTGLTLPRGSVGGRGPAAARLSYSHDSSFVLSNRHRDRWHYISNLCAGEMTAQKAPGRRRLPRRPVHKSPITARNWCRHAVGRRGVVPSDRASRRRCSEYTGTAPARLTWAQRAARRARSRARPLQSDRAGAAPGPCSRTERLRLRC